MKINHEKRQNSETKESLAFRLGRKVGNTALGKKMLERKNFAENMQRRYEKPISYFGKQCERVIGAKMAGVAEGAEEDPMVASASRLVDRLEAIFNSGGNISSDLESKDGATHELYMSHELPAGSLPEWMTGQLTGSTVETQITRTANIIVGQNGLPDVHSVTYGVIVDENRNEFGARTVVRFGSDGVLSAFVDRSRDQQHMLDDMDITPEMIDTILPVPELESSDAA